jgi:hypothetical protein
MAQKLLDGADVGAGLEQVSGEGMTQGVASDSLSQADVPASLTDRRTDCSLMQVMPAWPSGARAS